MKPTKVSYIKRPFARKSFASIGLSLAALVLFLAGLLGGVRGQGTTPLNVTAVCFCSLLVAVFGLGYGILALFEREKNYLLARISLGICGALTVVWLIMIIVGMRG